MKITFGNVTSSEIEVMLTASAESGDAIAQSIVNHSKGREYELTVLEAIYLRDNLWGDADRVAEGVSEAAGRAFERAGDKLNDLIQREAQA